MSHSPWDLVQRLRRQFESEVEDLLRTIKEIESRTGCIMPLYNLVETEDEYVLTVDMPGVRKEDIDMQVFEKHITIEAPCHMNIPSRRHGNRYRLMVELPQAINPETVKARYLHGVLEVRINKRIGRGVKINIE
jgi:HSP20 family protein